MTNDIAYMEDPFQDGTLYISDRRIPLNGPISTGTGSFFESRPRSLPKRCRHPLGPLGRGATRIQGDRQQTTLEIAGRAPVTADSAEQLVEEQIGWRLPVDHLLWWVRGLPAPDSPSNLQLDSSSRLGRLSQSGWTVEYSRYQEVDGVELPQRLQISGHDLLLTLVVTEWKPGLSE